MTVGGTAALYDTPLTNGKAAAGPSVLGRLYSLSANSVTFSAGEVSKTVNLTIAHRTTEGKHIPFVPETIIPMVSIDPLDAAYATAVNTNPVITVVDDIIGSRIVNVIGYGAVGNGIVDDTAAITAAFTAANALISNEATDQAIVYFPCGEHYKFYGPYGY